MVPKNAGSATMKGESLWPRLAGLPLVIEACEYERLHAVLAYEFERITTHVRLVGAGVDGLGEDISVFREDGTALHETRRALPLEGEWTLAAFCEHLETLELWPEPPEWDGALRFRRWAFESAALDLALRQAGHSLHDVLGLEPEPVRFVNSLGLGKEPSIGDCAPAVSPKHRSGWWCSPPGGRGGSRARCSLTVPSSHRSSRAAETARLSGHDVVEPTGKERRLECRRSPSSGSAPQRSCRVTRRTARPTRRRW
jgi:hypothetical protein